MPLLGEFSRSSRDSMAFAYDSHKSRDDRLNSLKSGMWKFFVLYYDGMMMIWYDHMIIWWQDDMVIWWDDDFMIRRYDRMMLWPYDHLMIRWCHDVKIWWCDYKMRILICVFFFLQTPVIRSSARLRPRPRLRPQPFCFQVDGRAEYLTNENT